MTTEGWPENLHVCLLEKIAKKSITLYFYISTLYKISIQTTITLFFSDNEEEDLKK